MTFKRALEKLCINGYRFLLDYEGNGNEVDMEDALYLLDGLNGEDNKRYDIIFNDHSAILYEVGNTDNKYIFIM